MVRVLINFYRYCTTPHSWL